MSHSPTLLNPRNLHTRKKLQSSKTDDSVYHIIIKTKMKMLFILIFDFWIAKVGTRLNNNVNCSRYNEQSNKSSQQSRGYKVWADWKKDCLKIAGRIMKDFKTNYIRRHNAFGQREYGEGARYSPKNHLEIDQQDWVKFVASRLTLERLALRKAQSEGARQNTLRHHAIRRGMVTLRKDVAELKEKVPIFPDVATTHRSPYKGKQMSDLPAMSLTGSQSNVRRDPVEKKKTFSSKVWAQIPTCLYFLVEEFLRRKGMHNIVEVPIDFDFMPPCTNIILTSGDVEQVGTLNYIGCQGMIFGIRCIWDDLTNMRDYFKFFDPELLNAMDKDGVIDQEVIKLVEWLNTMNNNSQMFFIPWNHDDHWMLEIVHLDPLSGHRRLR